MSADSPTIPVGPGSVCAECGAFYPEIPPEPPWRARDDGAALCSTCGPTAAQAGKAWHHKADPPQAKDRTVATVTIGTRVLTDEELGALNGWIFSADLPTEKVYDLSAALAELWRLRNPGKVIEVDP